MAFVNANAIRDHSHRALVMGNEVCDFPTKPVDFVDGARALFHSHPVSNDAQTPT